MGIPILVWKNVFGSLEGTFKFLWYLECYQKF
jgi:hypothetical protein